MYILQQLYSTNSLSTACLGQVIIKIMKLKISLRVQWTRLVVRGLKIISAVLVVNHIRMLDGHAVGSTHHLMWLSDKRDHFVCAIF